MSVDINTPKFDDPRRFITHQYKERNKSWEEIRNFKTRNFVSTADWLKSKCEEGWPQEFTDNPGLWDSLVDAREHALSRQLEQREMEFSGSESGTLSESTDPNFKIPSDEESAWQKYRQHLARKDFLTETIDKIEIECFKTLKCLKLDNVRNKKDIKGLVIGHVQSGKTANMAGLMAMAADHNFNMFIVLTGTIENLRKQTQDRLVKDLNQTGCIQNWTGLHKLRQGMETGARAADLRFDISRNNFLTVSLKNKSRLNSLLKWLKEYPAQLEQMNILLIDDESDQASINTRTDRARTAINRSIINLTKLQARSLNYVAYTATPYANVLNKAGADELYPKSFIRSLPLNYSYFGPELIFGAASINNVNNTRNNYKLNIVRDIPEVDVELITEMHSGENTDCPKTLEDSAAWFLCSAAARRCYGAKGPSSMLIHTSQRVGHHKILASTIEKLFSKNNISRLMTSCASIWKAETRSLSLDIFHRQYPDYEGKPSDYPDWSEVKPVIEALIEENINHIKLDEDGSVHYSKGIHLCIDNGTNNGTDDEGNFKRLLYPEEPLEFSPAFIVIGGATLSRGLTIEGLVSTFFLRTTRLGDTLMQMGRWFGYRQGYELLPRIWMTENAQDQFAYLASIEADLREEIKIYENSGAKPSSFGPKISHWAPSLLRITAKNRMQSAKTAESDFSGIRNENTIFYSNDTKLKKNVKETADFLKRIKQVPETPSDRGLLFRGIPFDAIKRYLLAMKFHPRSRIFAEIEMFIDWYEQVIEDPEGSPYTDWNVIVSSLRGVREWRQGDEKDKSVWKVAEKALKKVNRSRMKKCASSDAFSIGSLQDPMDKFLDIPEAERPQKAPKENKAVEIREGAGLGNTPQLIIYRINGRTNIEKLGEERNNLELDTDVIGLLMRVPGKPNKSLIRSITISIPENAYQEEFDLEEAD